MSQQESLVPPTLSVGQLNREARRLLESHFGFVWVEGEVSNFAAPSSGHWYFSLKDGAAQVRCAMFRPRNQHIRFTPENGMAIRLRCRVSLYEGRGEFQLIVEYLEHAGAGALQAAFEQLKHRLQLEGLFEAERKRPLPAQVKRLGVITSPTGAAIHDVLTVLRRRCPSIEVFLLPVPVQGDSAAGEIRDAIERANHWHREGKVKLDALLVTRGGGSLEDLWAFNEEVVARAIVASELPVVSAVGHEVDISIADMVADSRGATPSAAAELLSPDQREWLLRLQRIEQDLQRQVRSHLLRANRELAHLQQRLKHPGHLLREQAQRLDELEQRLHRAQRNQLRQHRAGLALLANRLAARSPVVSIHRRQSDCSQLEERLRGAMVRKLERAGTRLAHLAQVLDSVSPLATLQRGYAIISTPEGQVIKDAASVAPGDTLNARLAHGSLGLTVRSTEI